MSSNIRNFSWDDNVRGRPDIAAKIIDKVNRQGDAPAGRVIQGLEDARLMPRAKRALKDWAAVTCRAVDRYGQLLKLMRRVELLCYGDFVGARNSRTGIFIAGGAVHNLMEGMGLPASRIDVDMFFVGIMSCEAARAIMTTFVALLLRS